VIGFLSSAVRGILFVRNVGSLSTNYRHGVPEDINHTPSSLSEEFCVSIFRLDDEGI
jgi:hypothetical protein